MDDVLIDQNGKLIVLITEEISYEVNEVWELWDEKGNGQLSFAN